jgi:hypothetical protein
LTLSLLTLSLLTLSLLTLSLLTLSLLTLSLLTLVSLALARIPFAALLAACSLPRLTISRHSLTRVALARLPCWVLCSGLSLVQRVLTGLPVASAATFARSVAVGLCLPRLDSIGGVVASLPAVIENPLHRLAVIGPIGSHRRAGLLIPALLTPAFLVATSALATGLRPLGWAVGTVSAIGLFAVRPGTCATLPVCPPACARATGSAGFSTLPLRGALLLVVLSGLRLLAALLTAAGSAALLPRLRFALLTAVLLWLPLLRLALLCSTRFLAICRLLLLAALLSLRGFFFLGRTAVPAEPAPLPSCSASGSPIS